MQAYPAVGGGGALNWELPEGLAGREGPCPWEGRQKEVGWDLISRQGVSVCTGWSRRPRPKPPEGLRATGFRCAADLATTQEVQQSLALTAHRACNATV